MTKKFLGGILVLLIGTILQLVFGEAFGIWISFALAALVAAAFSLGLLQFFFLVLLAAFFLNWQPALSYELIFIAGFAFLAFATRESFPWHRWLSAALFTLLGVAAMYIVFAPSIFLLDAPVFLTDALGSTLFAIAAFKVIKIL